DLIEQRFAIAFDVTVVYCRELDELRARNALGHIARVGDVDHALRGTVPNERWDPNGGQYLAHVDVAVHFHDRDRRAGACRCAEIGSPAFGTLGIAGEARSVHGDRYALRRSPMTLEIIEHALPLLVLPAKWIVRAPGRLGVGAVQDQRRGPRRVCCGIKERHRSTLHSAARFDPTSSRMACTSCMRCSSAKICELRSDMPVPRLSKRMTRLNEARRWKNARWPADPQIASMLETNPGTNSRSSGPSPNT